jgi:16S rRNA (guanine(966)-N(2))-methyltransferase RsmD
MKIIAGKFKGRNLTYRERRGLRVTSQLVKEAMFGIIGDRVENSIVLDLYCGYGTLGLEAISRGAKKVIFADTDGQALKQLKFFLEKLEVVEQGELIKRDSIKVVKHLEPRTMDIVVMDPPYHIRFEEKTLEAISKSEILKINGLCVVEHYSENSMPDTVGKLQKVKSRVYGDTALSIYLNTSTGPVSAELCVETTPDENATREMEIPDEILQE